LIWNAIERKNNEFKKHGGWIPDNIGYATGFVHGMGRMHTILKRILINAKLKN
jgi:hypothetical protein